MDTVDNASRETHRFQAEVSQVLHLVIHSLYSHREVFLRELISNASDAIDKLRFRAITEPSLVEVDGAPSIRLRPDEAAGTLTLEDDGVGMTRAELIENLGTIAHSGSRKFLEAVKSQQAGDSVNLIGQFGVGFYSAWLVADRVEVISRAAGTDEAWCFSSDAREEFAIEPATRDHPGTTVVLHLRDDQKEFTDRYRLRELVKRYSDFVAHPILLEKDAEEAKEGDGWETVNVAKALWQRPKAEIPDEEYQTFYQHLTLDHEPPVGWIHFKVEGNQEFAGILYLPRVPPFDLDTPGERRHGMRLYVKRVFIMDDCDALVPVWLRFARGVIDSDDLPLNVNRETLQDSSIVRGIKKALTRKGLELLDDLAQNRPDDYTTFWATFGRILKEGLHMDWEYRDRLAALVRYESSHGEGLTSLADYVSRMPEGQKSIYYVVGDSKKAVVDSPHIEAVRSRGYEVLYMTDIIDTWAAEGLREFQGKRLVSVQNADLSLDDTPEAKKEKEGLVGALSGLLGRVRTVLGGRIKDVRASDRLTDSPACLVVPPGGVNAQIERVLRAHGRDVPETRRILEVNPTHPLIQRLNARLAANPDDAQVGEYIELLYDQAMMTEGTPLEDPQRFARRLTALMQQSLPD